jgi:hypothetical protein
MCPHACDVRRSNYFPRVVGLKHCIKSSRRHQYQQNNRQGDFRCDLPFHADEDTQLG